MERKVCSDRRGDSCLPNTRIRGVKSFSLEQATIDYIEAEAKRLSIPASRLVDQIVRAHTERAA